MLPSSVNPNGVLEAIDLEPTAARLAPARCCQSLQSWRLEVALPACEETAVLPARTCSATWGRQLRGGKGHGTERCCISSPLMLIFSTEVSKFDEVQFVYFSSCSSCFSCHT